MAQLEHVQRQVDSHSQWQGSDAQIDRQAYSKESTHLTSKHSGLNSDAFGDRLRKNFSRVDKNCDGVITKKEVDLAIGDKSFTAEDAGAVVALKRAFADLEKLGKPRGMNDWLWLAVRSIDASKGVSLADIAKAETLDGKVKADAAAVGLIASLGEVDYWNLDANHNDFVSKVELNEALSKKSLSPSQRQALTEVSSRWDAIVKASNGVFLVDGDGITQAKVREFVRQFQLSDNYKLVATIAQSMKQTYTQSQQLNKDLFANKHRGLGSIVPEAVRQGDIGDCYFLAALSSLAKVKPQAIKDMIQDNGDGTYTVTFPGAANEPPVKVASPTTQELMLYAKATADGTWAAVIEKSYGMYRNRHKWPFRGSEIASEGGDGGGSLKMGLEILTGHTVDVHHLMFSSQTIMDQRLMDAMSKRYAVTAATATDLFAGDAQTQTIDGFAVGHAYSVTGYDRQTKTVTIYDPAGLLPNQVKGSAVKPGHSVVKISLGQFLSNFSMVAVSQSP